MHHGTVSADRLHQVSQALIRAATDTEDTAPKFSRLWNETTQGVGGYVRLPTRVRFDNDTSENFTVIDVFAHDRKGLLYAITRALYECGASVAVAKIGTYLDQVVDVFYVTDLRSGGKIEDEDRVSDIRQRLLEAIDGTAETMVDPVTSPG